MEPAGDSRHGYLPGFCPAVDAGNRRGWLAFDFTSAPVDWDEVGELMESSYRQVALVRMVKALDQRAGR
jgi:hypothetical protein